MRRLAVAAVALALVAAAPALGQSIQVDPPSAPAGTEITAEAFDFLPGELVTLQFGGQTLAEGQADDEGFVRLVGTIPDLPPGEHPLLVGSETAQVDLMYEVLEPTETPTETEPTVEGEGPGVVETDTTSSGTNATSSDDGGFPWLPVAVVGGLLLAGTGFLVGRKSDKRKPPPPERKPVPPTGTAPPPPAGGSGSEAPTQVVPAGAPAGATSGTGAAAPYRLQCQERERRKEIVPFLPLDSKPEIVDITVTGHLQGGPCVWTATYALKVFSWVDVFRCVLELGHSEPHVFSERLEEEREPSVAAGYHEEKMLEREKRIVLVDPTCGMTGEEVWARFMLRCNVCGEQRGDAPVCPHCGMGDPEAKPMGRESILRKWREQTGGERAPGACRVCGEPRGDVTPCPHCGSESGAPSADAPQ